MIKKRKKNIGIYLVVLFVCSSLIYPQIQGKTVNQLDSKPIKEKLVLKDEDKIQKNLKKEIEKIAEKGNLTVSIWFEDIDYGTVEEKVKDKLKIDNLDKADKDSVQKYIELKRELVKEAYATQNKIYYAKYIPNDSVIYISEYAPYIIVNLPAKNIAKLVKNKEVSAVDMYYEREKIQETSYSIPNINGKYTRDTKGLNGNGVKVGILETHYADKTNAQLSDRNIIFDISDAQAANDKDAHATKVTSIIVGKTQGLVPNAQVYLAAGKNRIQDYQKIEWLISQGVNVINYSAGYGGANGLYTDMAKWIDHLSYQLNVNFVKSAGNGGSSYGITDPGMAYNGITVGSINENNSTFEPNWTDDVFSSISSYTETEGGFKPDLTAPGEGITVAGYTNSSGTSYSAPHVTGIIAQMFQLKADLKVKTCALNALLKAGTTHKTATDYGQYSLCSDYSDREGAGVVDGKGSYNTAYFNRYTQIQLNDIQFPYTQTINITSTNKPVRVAINWMKQNSLSNGAVVERSLSDLDLYIYGPNGSLVKTSISANNNTELVEFVPTVTGNYTVQVDGYLLENPSEVIGVSWNQ